MTVSFEEDKICKAYEECVCNPTDRQCIKHFGKKFNINLLESAIKIHNRIINAPNAKIYNNVAGHNNKFELLDGEKNNDNQTLKVRINQDYRKFFRIKDSTGEFCLVKNWDGNFENINHIYVYMVNKHKYNK